MLHFNYLGSWFQVSKDKLVMKKESIEEFLNDQLNCVLTTWLKISYNGLKKLMMVIISYLDLTTDVILLSTTMMVLGESMNNYKLFSTQLALILLLSIIVPLFISAMIIASNSPLLIMRPKQWKRLSYHQNSVLVAARILIVGCFPTVPAMLILSKENAVEKRTSLKSKNYTLKDLVKQSVLEECEVLTEYIDETRKALLTFKRHELSIELVIQLSIHLIMLLLSQTIYPLESGLQSVFQESDKESSEPSWWLTALGLQDVKADNKIGFFVFSIIWSFKTCAKTSVKIKTETKSFLSLFPKLVLYLRYLCVFLIRISCIVAYYAPYIGLLDILSHHQAEKISLDAKSWCHINGTDDQSFHYWNQREDKFQSVKIENLFRSVYGDCSDNSASKLPEIPSTSLYTIIRLGTAFGLFWAFYTLYAVTLTLIKKRMSTDFQSSALGKKMQHIIEAVNIPEAFGDWDTNLDLDVEGHRNKWEKVFIEMLVMVLMQLISNMFLLLPFLTTGQ